MVASTPPKKNRLWWVHYWLQPEISPMKMPLHMWSMEALYLYFFVQKPHMTYIIHKSTTKWWSYNCMYACQGYICKHFLKVLQLLNPSFAEGTVARVCNNLQGTCVGMSQNGLTPILKHRSPLAQPWGYPSPRACETLNVPLLAKQLED